VPPRDPGRIPSLPYSKGHEHQKKPLPITGVPPKDMQLKVFQDLAVASSTPRPTSPLPPSLFPTKEKEKIPNLSELI
jgi:hypothetical protein